MDIWQACKAGSIERVKFLINERNVNVNKERWSGITPLHRAAQGDHVEILKLLVEHGGNLNQKTSWGWYTPLHEACRHGHIAAATYLIEAGANYGALDKMQRTPRMLAIECGQSELVFKLTKVATRTLRKRQGVMSSHQEFNITLLKAPALFERVKELQTGGATNQATEEQTEDGEKEEDQRSCSSQSSGMSALEEDDNDSVGQEEGKGEPVVESSPEIQRVE